MVTFYFLSLSPRENCSRPIKIFVKNQLVMRTNETILRICHQNLSVFKNQPTSGHLFVFYNQSKDKIKILQWDRNGFFLYYKRLEKGKFQFKKIADEVVELSTDQLSWLLAGLDFMLMNDFKELNYRNYY